jgi:hypothetical protein
VPNAAAQHSAARLDIGIGKWEPELLAEKPAANEPTPAMSEVSNISTPGATRAFRGRLSGIGRREAA